MQGMGIRDGRGYGPYKMGYEKDDLDRHFPLGPDGRALPLEYDYQPGGPNGSFLPLRRPKIWLPHLGPDPGPEDFGITPSGPDFASFFRGASSSYVPGAYLRGR